MHPLRAVSSFAVGLLRHCLMGSSPGRPSDHESRLDPAFGEACGPSADFLDRPVHQRGSLATSFLFWVSAGVSIR